MIGTELNDLPGFVKYNKESQTYVVFSKNPLDEGEYALGLKICFTELKDFQTTCTTNFKVKYEPIEDQKLACDENWIFKMPDYLDFSGAKLDLEINLQVAKSFLKIENDLIKYEPTFVVSADYVIKYSVTSNEKSKEF